MSVWFGGCLHLGHRNISRFRITPGGITNDEYIVSYWKQKVTKRCHVWLLGDAAVDYKSLQLIKSLPGTKHLIGGNHDLEDAKILSEVFSKIGGIVRYKRMWLTHCPVHPQCLEDGRVGVNLHAHTHGNGPDDPRYLTTDVEAMGKPLIHLDEVREIFKARGIPL